MIARLLTRNKQRRQYIAVLTYRDELRQRLVDALARREYELSQKLSDPNQWINRDLLIDMLTEELVISFGLKAKTRDQSEYIFINGMIAQTIDIARRFGVHQDITENLNKSIKERVQRELEK